MILFVHACIVLCMKLSILKSNFSICRLAPDVALPAWSLRGEFFSISKTEEELSIVCEESLVPDDVKSEKNWRALKVEGPLDFSLTGVLASIASPLAEAKISIFAISTFDTDYILVKSADLESAKGSLISAGFEIKT